MIRPAVISDIEAIYLLGEQLHANYRKTNDLMALFRLSTYHFWVAVSNEEIVGFLSAVSLSDHMDLLDLFVSEAYRKMGYGGLLLQACKEKATEEQLDVFLEVAKENTPALSLYEKNGFHVISTRKDYYEGQDGFLMKWRWNDET